MKIRIDSLTEMQRFAEKLASKVSEFAASRSLTIGFCGDLGSGKTTFIRLLLKNFGLLDVDSPSYVLVKEYISTTNDLVFEHWDVYRLARSTNSVAIATLDDLGIFEPLSLKRVRLIEWADVSLDLLDSCDITVRLDFSDISIDNEEVRVLYLDTELNQFLSL